MNEHEALPPGSYTKTSPAAKLIQIEWTLDKTKPKWWRLLGKIARQGYEIVQLKAKVAQLQAELRMFHRVIESAQSFREAAEQAAAAQQELQTHMARATSVELGKDFSVGHSRRVPNGPDK